MTTFLLLFFVCQDSGKPLFDFLESPSLYQFPDYRKAKTHSELYETLKSQIRFSANCSHPHLPVDVADAAWNFQKEDGSFPFRDQFKSDLFLFQLAILSEAEGGDSYAWLERYAAAKPEARDMLRTIYAVYSKKCEFEESVDEETFLMNLVTMRKYLLACSKSSCLLRPRFFKPNSFESLEEPFTGDYAWFQELKPYRAQAKAAWEKMLDQILNGTPICDLLFPLPE